MFTLDLVSLPPEIYKEEVGYSILVERINQGVVITKTIKNTLIMLYLRNSKINFILFFTVISVLKMNAQPVITHSSGLAVKDYMNSVLWMKFNEKSGTIATDYSSNGNIAAFNSSPNWSNGIVDNAVSIASDGISAIIKNSKTLDISGNKLSISGWIKVPETSRQKKVVLCKPYFSKDVAEKTWTFPFYSYALISNGNYLSFHIGREGDITLGMASAHFLEPDKWYHFAVTYDGTRANWYLNGKFSNTVPTTGTIKPTGTPLILFNDARLDPAQNWKGSLDDLHIYDRVLSPAEIALLAMPVIQTDQVGPATKVSVYPVKPSTDNRYLVDQNNVPYLIAGDSPHWLFVNLPQKEVEFFLADRHNKGINTLWVEILVDETLGGRKDLSTFDGLLPFITPGDLATPNEAYFARMDSMVAICNRYGIQLLFGPGHYSSLWLKTLKTNGLDKTRQFGNYLGNRFRKYGNIIWMSGDDFQTWAVPGDDSLMLALAWGIKEKNPENIQTIELEWHTSGSLDDPDWEPVISLNASYTYFPTYAQVYLDYNRPNHLPVFMVEANYELDHFIGIPVSPELLRRQEYWPILSGANAGVVYGHRNVSWHKITPDWKAALNSPGAIQFAAFAAFFRLIPWYSLVPDQQHKVLTKGYGNFTPASRDQKNETWKKILDDDYATTAQTQDGTIIVSYIPTKRTVTIDMSKLKGQAKGQWFDPATGIFMNIQGSTFTNVGSRNFTTPGLNGDGDQDWVLLLQTL